MINFIGTWGLETVIGILLLIVIILSFRQGRLESQLEQSLESNLKLHLRQKDVNEAQEEINEQQYEVNDLHVRWLQRVESQQRNIQYVDEGENKAIPSPEVSKKIH